MSPTPGIDAPARPAQAGKNAGGSAAEPAANGWFLRRLPPRARPYARLARLDRPIGSWLLLLPCWWGLALAGGGAPDPWLLALFAVGAMVMRAAGCTINDIADRDFDAKVARTKDRPLASGAITLRQAHIFLGALLLAALGVLLALDNLAKIVALASIPLVLVYPFTKRVTDWPQAFLGLTFNWGALVGYAHVAGELAVPAFLLYGAGFFWTLGYDTIYAHQDKEDDLLIGVRSSALRLGARTRPALFAFYALAIAGIAAAGIAAGLSPWFLFGLGAGAVQLAWQAATVRLNEPADCLAKFKSNLWFGLLIFAGIAAGRALPFPG